MDCLGFPKERVPKLCSRPPPVAVTEFCACDLFQSFKRKPGQADEERSMGEDSERVSKRLRTVDSREDEQQDRAQNRAQQESDLYQHIKEGEPNHDAQTYGTKPGTQTSSCTDNK